MPDQLLPISEVYSKLSALLFPRDESKCRVCAMPLEGPKSIGCTKDHCPLELYYHVQCCDKKPDLACWNGVGMVVEEMEKRLGPNELTFVIQGGKFFEDKPLYQVFFYGGDGTLTFWSHYGDTPWEAVARAALKVLEAK